MKHSNSHSGELVKKIDEAYPLTQALTDRGKAALTLVVDTAFLAFWIGLVWGFNEYVIKPIGTLAGLDGFILKALQVIFGVPIIFQALAFTVVDLSGLLSSTIAILRKQWKE